MTKFFQKIGFLVLFSLLFPFNAYLLPVKAHPQPLVVHEFIYRYRVDKIDLEFNLRIDPVVVEDIFKVIDKNSDSKLDEDELRSYANEYVLGKLTSRLNNRDLKYEIVEVKPVTKDQFRSLDDFASIKFKTIEPLIQSTNSVYVKYDFKFLPNDIYGDYYAYQDDMFEVPGIERINLENTNPNGTVDYSTDYRFTDAKPTTTNSINPINGNNPGAQNSNFFTDFQKLSTEFTNQVKNFNFNNPFVFLTAFILLFVAGALHALTPGHGKSMVAAFLIGKKKSKLIDVLILGLAITLAHTLVIYIIGFVLLAIRETANAQNIVLFIERVSAWLFLGLGLILIYNGWRAYQHYSFHNRSLRGNSKVVPHSHDHEHIDPKKMNIRSRWDLFYAGISGGIVPCFDALSILFVFNSLGRVDLGLILVFVFSLGLAAAIILLGISLLYGKDKLKLEERIGPRAEYILPFISGGIIALFGIFYILTK